jgi:hypothetical protein
VRIDDGEAFAVGNLIKAEIRIHPLFGLQHAVQGDHDRAGVIGLPARRHVHQIMAGLAAANERVQFVGACGERGEQNQEGDRKEPEKCRALPHAGSSQ